MAKITVQELNAMQKDLCDSLVTDTEKMAKIMKQYTFKSDVFHRYTLRNFILASGQLFARTGETAEVLAPYKRWRHEKVNRYVKKGESALWILAPIKKKVGDDENDEPVYKTWFKRVPVFDLSQTDGEPFIPDFVSGKSELTFKEICDKLPMEIRESQKTVTRGYTDGEKIWISRNMGEEKKISVLFHELAHFKLHFNGEKLEKGLKELEAEAVSYMCSSAIGIYDEESTTYINSWVKENPAEAVKGRGSRLIKCAEEILKDVGVIVEDKED